MNDIEQIRAMIGEHDPARDVRATGAQGILDEVTRAAAPPARRRRRRLAFALPATAALAASLVAVSAIGWPSTPMGPRPAQALSLHRTGGSIEVRIIDPDADPARYRREFAAAGLDVDLRMLPASPGLVGRMASYSAPGTRVPPPIKVLDADRACGDTWCPSGVSLPKGLRQRIELTFGRPARPGEGYVLTGSAGSGKGYSITGDPKAPHEPLAGLTLRDRTVADVRRDLAARRFPVGRYLAAPPEPRPAQWSYDEHVLKPADVSGTWYVTDAWLGRTKGTVELAVAPTKR